MTEIINTRDLAEEYMREITERYTARQKLNSLDYDLSSAMAYLASIAPPTPMVAQALALAERAQASGEWDMMKTALAFARAAYADWQANGNALNRQSKRSDV